MSASVCTRSMPGCYRYCDFVISLEHFRVVIGSVFRTTFNRTPAVTINTRTEANMWYWLIG